MCLLGDLENLFYPGNLIGLGTYPTADENSLQMLGILC